MSISESPGGVPAGAPARCAPLVRGPMTADRAAQVVPLLKAIADPVRLRLLSLVVSHEGGEACACDLLPEFDLSQPTISHHLKVLHEAGLLHREKRGVWVWFRARPEALDALAGLFTTEGLAPAAVPLGAGG